MRVPATFKNKIPEITILLDETDEKNLKKFHCVVCGKVVFEYYNLIDIIVSGRHYHKSPKVVQCNNIVVMDMLTQQVVNNITTEEYNCNRDRYFRTKCRTKYWIS